MTDAIQNFAGTYIGLVFIWPVAVAALALCAERRYDPEVADDLRRIAGPGLGLLFLAAPIVIQYPLAGLIALALWVAYSDQILDAIIGPTPPGKEGPSQSADAAAVRRSEDRRSGK